MNRMKYIFFALIITGGLLMSGCATTKKEKPDRPAVVKINTTMGDIKIRLMPYNAPVTVANFLKYVDDGFYKGTVFHRVIPGFMIQGGGFSPSMEQKKTLPPIVNEASNEIANTRGTIAMARTQDINSATSQFFINVADNEFLNHKANDPLKFGYCVFGAVIEGMEVVDSIVKVETKQSGPHGDVPVIPVVIESITRCE